MKVYAPTALPRGLSLWYVREHPVDDSEDQLGDPTHRHGGAVPIPGAGGTEVTAGAANATPKYYGRDKAHQAGFDKPTSDCRHPTSRFLVSYTW